MNLTRIALANPAAAIVTTVLAVIAGAVSLFELPIQLLPAIDQPQITVWTRWRGAAPADMESVIVEQQERALRNIPGLEHLQSNIQQGTGGVVLSFAIGADMQRAYLDVINRLQQVPALPRDADGPWVNMGGDDFSGGNAASLLVRTLDHADTRDPADFHELIKREVEPLLARIPGVSQVQLQSQRPEEVLVELRAERAAALGIPLADIVRALTSATDVSGGFVDVGRRQYTVRMLGQVEIPELGALVVTYRNGRPVPLSEVAQVSVQRQEAPGFTLRNGYPAYYLTLGRESGSNTIAILDAVNDAIGELNRGPLAGAGLSIELSYDASVHIRRAIRLVQGNLLLGGLLATLVLFAFLRRWRSTLLVGLAIPVCLFTAFIALNFTGRSLNVISLAGLAFAVGLVLDAAIIVLENIVRKTQSGMPLADACSKGAEEVAPALLASTATSVAIFLPILFMTGPEGQLFADLALTLSVAVVVSLIVALALLPVIARWALRGDASAMDPFTALWSSVTALSQRWTTPLFMRISIILLCTAGATALAWSLLPSADYLPQARSDNVWANFSIPPGASQRAVQEDLADIVVQRLEPHMSGEKQPRVAYYNLSSWNRTWTGMALYPHDPREADEMMRVLREDILVGLPDTRAYVSPGSLLNFAGGGNRQIDFDIHGARLEDLIDAAQVAMGLIKEALPDVPVRPRPDLELAEPELQLIPDPVRLAQVGLTRQDLGDAVRAFTDGLYVGEYFDGNERLNMLLRSQRWTRPEELASLPIATPNGGVQQLGQLARFERTVGPSELRRIDGQRTITLRIFPPEQLTLEDAIATLQEKVEPAVLAALRGEGSVQYRGSADGLEQALQKMGMNLLWALLILLLLLTAMFRSLRDALLVVSVMPLACAGGALALWLMNLFSYQSLDLLTMSGFVILLGLVVNNSILLVDRARKAEACGHPVDEAIRQAVRERARPIFMSTTTSLFGMLPLMLVPGTGAEIYRGLASIIVGGLFVSATLTLLLLPSLLRLTPARTPSAQAAAPSAARS